MSEILDGSIVNLSMRLTRVASSGEFNEYHNVIDTDGPFKTLPGYQAISDRIAEDHLANIFANFLLHGKSN